MSDVGEVIQSEITSLGFAPIRNLSGHGMARFELHSKPTVPNFANNDPAELHPGQIIAIEPFATTGEGVIVEATSAEVFAEVSKKPVRDMTSRQVLKEIEKYEKMPFAKRWLIEKFPPVRVEMALRQLQQAGAVQGFPPLVERARGACKPGRAFGSRH